MRPARTLPALTIAAALALTACGGSSSPTAAAPSPETYTVGGALTITSHLGFAGDSETPGNTCTGMGGMRDIGAGTTVRVATDSGTTLALGALGAGVTDDGFGCRFAWSIPDVPLGGGAFYVVEVGTRGQVRVERADLLGGTVALTL